MLPLATVNTQPPEPLSLREDGALEVHSIFLTIQGEGPLAGTPAVFLRLAGCNWDCKSCDTEYTSTRELLPVSACEARVLSAAVAGDSAANLLVLTGGEPFRQNVSLLVERFLGEGWQVQIETNGTLPPPFGFVPATRRFSLVCSPKAPKVHGRTAAIVDAYKYIVDADNVDEDGLPKTTMGQPLAVARPPAGFPRDRVYVQPLDVGDPEQNRRNERAAVASCLKHGYKLSYQIHKHLGLE